MLRKPMSTGLAMIGLLGILYFGYTLLTTGSVYISSLNDLDGTTLVMISVLIVTGGIAFKELNDLQAFGTVVIIVLSFIFLFESIYKFLFFDWVTDPEDLRTLLLQFGTASAIFLPLGLSYVRFNKAVYVFLALYVLFMFIWWITGYPQIFETEENRVIFLGADRIAVSLNSVFIWNRLTKIWLFLAFLFSISNKIQNRAYVPSEPQE